MIRKVKITKGTDIEKAYLEDLDITIKESRLEEVYSVEQWHFYYLSTYEAAEKFLSDGYGTKEYDDEN